MTNTERQDIFTTAVKIAGEDADKHFTKLVEAFNGAIPEYVRSADDPPAKRPYGFTIDAESYQIFLELGERCAETSVVFTYRKTLGIWKVKRFKSRIGRGPITFSQIESKTLANAILASKELYQESEEEAKKVESRLASVSQQQEEEKLIIN